MKKESKEVEHYWVQITNKCPFCGLKGKETTESLVKEARNCSTLFVCENIHLWGRGT